MKGDEYHKHDDMVSEQSVPLSRIYNHKQRKLRYIPQDDDSSVSKQRKAQVEQILEHNSRENSVDSEEERFLEWQKRREMQCKYIL